MTSAERRLRIFVSSTFVDMQEERDILVKKVFPQLRKMCEERAVAWTEVDLRWGITDQQKAEGQVVPLCLEEIRRSPFFISILGERYGPVTELEIAHGLFGAGRSYCYFRDPRYGIHFAPETSENREKLRVLKERIRAAASEKRCTLREGYTDPKQLGDWILEDWSRRIEEIFPSESVPDEIEQETARHETHARGLRHGFIGREDLLTRLREADNQAVVLTGDSGCGKSALLAEWVARWRADHPDDLVVEHYIGSTAASADWQSVVRRILGEIKRTFAVADEIPVESNALRKALHEWPAKAAVSRRIVIVLDGLNQLADNDAAGQLGWLPAAFPANVRLLVSSLPGDSLGAVRRRGWQEVNVPLFGRNEVAAATLVYFRLFGKTPPADVVSRLVGTPAAGNPLYLRAVLNELRQFGRHEELEATAKAYLSAPDLPELFNRILARWDNDFGREPECPNLVRRALSLIACSRGGLSEAELMDLLGDDGPIARRYWTSFYLAAEEALAVRAGLLDFGHEHLRAAVFHRYLTVGDIHHYRSRIAAYLVDDRRTHWFSAPIGSPIVNRVLDEVPWQLVETQQWEALYGFLAHLPLLGAMYTHVPFDVRRYWVRLEKRSSYRMAEAYREVLEKPEAHGRYLQMLASLFAATGNAQDASRLLAAHVDKLRSEGNDAALLSSLLDLAAALHELSDFRGSLGLLEEAERLVADEETLGHVLGEQALNHQRLNKLDRAMELLLRQEQICRRSGEKLGLANCLSNQSGVHLFKEDARRALELQTEVEQIRTEFGDLHGLADSLNTQALAHYALGNRTATRSLLARHRKTCRTIGHVAGLADGLSLAAQLEREAKKPERSKTLLGIAATLHGSTGRTVKLAHDLEQIALYLEGEGRLDEGADALVQSLEYFVEAGDSHRAARIAIRHAGILARLGRYGDAAASLETAIGLDPPPDVAARVWGSLAEVLLSAGEPQSALDAVDAIAAPGGVALATRSKVLRELGRTEESLSAIEAAERSFEADGAHELLVIALLLHAQILLFDAHRPSLAAPLLQQAKAIAEREGLKDYMTPIRRLVNET